MDLALTGRRRGQLCSANPLGDGPQLLVRRYGRLIGYCADADGLAALGVDVSRMAVADRW